MEMWRHRSPTPQKQTKMLFISLAFSSATHVELLATEVGERDIRHAIVTAGHFELSVLQRRRERRGEKVEGDTKKDEKVLVEHEKISV